MNQRLHQPDLHEVEGTFVSKLVMRVTDPSAYLFRLWGLDSHKALIVVWTSIRLAVLLVWGIFRPETQGDVVYYFTHIRAMFSDGPQQIMMEYPTPVLWLLSIPYLLSGGHRTGYVIVFAIIMVALDACFSLSLWRQGGSLRAQAVTIWSVFVGCIGPTIYLRFDIVTSVIAGWSLLSLSLLHRREAGGLAGLGAAIKLWPALLWPALCVGTRKDRHLVTIGFWSSGIFLAIASWIWAGWDRLISPLTWQSGRGLQIESVWASVPVALRAFHIGDFAVTVSRFQAFEIYGTSVDLWITLSGIATVIGLAILVIFYISWLIRGHTRLIEAAAFTLLVILMMITTNKTFSPQYMIWLGGPLCAALAILGNEDRTRYTFLGDRRRLLTLTAGILLATVLTGIVFPIGYEALVRDFSRSAWFRFPISCILVVRNGLIVALMIQVVRWIISFIKPTWWRNRVLHRDHIDSYASTRRKS